MKGESFARSQMTAEQTKKKESQNNIGEVFKNVHLQVMNDVYCFRSFVVRLVFI